MNKLTKREEAAMEPFVAMYMQMANAIHAMPTHELHDLRLAAEGHGETNCWFRAYDAAGVVSSLISRELVQREVLGRSTLTGTKQ
jgi:hypothetical protein